VICDFAISQVSDDIRQELINLYTQYAQSKSATERLQYIRSPESYREIFATRYGDRDVSYTPIRFGKAGRPITNSTLDVYSLEEYMSANQGGRTVEVVQYRQFVKIGNNYKIDWEASVCYNPVTLTRFKALQDGQIATIRCYASLTNSSYDDYFAFSLRDEATNYQFTAYIRKNSEDGLSLMDFLERGDARPVVLEMKYVDNISRYNKEVIINKFISRGWIM
jgi:hypothetical protein